METIDLQPTGDGYKRMRLQFIDAIERHEADIKILEDFINGDTDIAVNPLADLLDEAVSLLTSEKYAAITNLRESINDIETYFKTKGVEF